jgi:hypothetical protein
VRNCEEANQDDSRKGNLVSLRGGTEDASFGGTAAVDEKRGDDMGNRVEPEEGDQEQQHRKAKSFPQGRKRSCEQDSAATSEERDIDTSNPVVPPAKRHKGKKPAVPRAACEEMCASTAVDLVGRSYRRSWDSWDAQNESEQQDADSPLFHPRAILACTCY